MNTVREYDERVCMNEPGVGTVVAYRVGRTEISASRLGVLMHGGSLRTWRWGVCGFPRNVRNTPAVKRVDRALEMAWSDFRALTN